jgi:hypothetical protein
MNTKPNITGYYWLRTYSSFGTPNRPEIVLICMEYTFRKKVVPYVISTIWRGPLGEVEGDWSEILPSPF